MVLLLACAAPDVTPDSAFLAPSVVRRLTTGEIDNILGDVLLDPRRPAATFLPQDVSPPFDNIAVSQVVSRASVEGASLLAADVSSELAAHPDRLAAIVPCAVNDACYADFVHGIGRRLIRRSASNAEVSALVDAAVTTHPGDPAAAYGFLVEVLLQDPELLFQVEREPAGTDPIVAISSQEAANRLALVLWGSAPDDSLLQAADLGLLADSTERARIASAMLEDPRALRQMQAFHAAWLGYDVAPPGMYLFEADGLSEAEAATIAAGIRQEADELVAQTLFRDDQPWAAILATSQAWVTPELAALYGVPEAETMTGSAWMDVSVVGRAGILSTTAYLGAASRVLTTSPTLRGKAVQERLLCNPIAPPPPDVVSAAPPTGTEDSCQSERYLAHATDPACAGCHAQMDPIGNGLERYDHLGRYREYESEAVGEGVRTECPISGTGDLHGVPFSGPVELSRLVGSDPDFPRCMVEQLLAFSTGQSVAPALVDLLAEGGADLHYREVLLEWVARDAFVQRERQ